MPDGARFDLVARVVHVGRIERFRSSNVVESRSAFTPARSASHSLTPTPHERLWHGGRATGFRRTGGCASQSWTAARGCSSCSSCLRAPGCPCSTGTRASRMAAPKRRGRVLPLTCVVRARLLCSIVPGSILLCTDVVTASVTVTSRTPRTVYLSTQVSSFYRLIAEEHLAAVHASVRARPARASTVAADRLTPCLSRRSSRTTQIAALVPPLDDALTAYFCRTPLRPRVRARLPCLPRVV